MIDDTTRKGHWPSAYNVPTQPGKTFSEYRQALARTDDPATSHAAARAVTPKVQRLQALILDALAGTLYGYTAREIAAKTGLDFASVSPRLKPLEALGHVTRAATKRATFNRPAAIVWRITDKGTGYLLQKSTEPA